VLFKIDFLGQVPSQKSVMMSAMRNQNMDSCKSSNRYQVMSEVMSEDMNEFPSLSDASTVKQTKTSGKKNVIKLVVPLKTYKDELREKYTTSRPVLENFKTRMCNSLDTNEVCRHGEECRFAHYLEELVIRDCHFKDKCRFVKIKSGKLVNDGSNTCRNKHPQESQEDFIKRTGLSHYKTRAPKHEEINLDDEQPPVNHEEINIDDEQPPVNHEEINIDDEQPPVNHEEINIDDVQPPVKHEEIKVRSFACDRQTNYKSAAANRSTLRQDSGFSKPIDESPTFKFGEFPAFKFINSLDEKHLPSAFKLTRSVDEKPLPTTFKFGGPSLEKEIVLRVPKVLAMQALELAMNSGNRCIRVEVIE
jgi:hypothetical protein